jgi:3'(2'), 5'-bisphosphate nucleotidase
MIKHSNLLDLCIIAALEAGEAVLNVYNSNDFGIITKEDNSPLTKADKIAHEIIESYLMLTDIPILSEEGIHLNYNERKLWKKVWIVDPIDGTKEFIKRNGEFTINIALIEDESPILGVIYAPALQELYFANKNGAFKVAGISIKNKSEAMSSKVALPIVGNRKGVVAIASKSHFSDQTMDFLNLLKDEFDTVSVISKGSSLKFGLLAEGSADFYPRFTPTMEWDTAAGQAICLFAGCKVIDWESKRNISYNRNNLTNNSFLAFSNKHHAFVAQLNFE